jgi:AcrR family transcriptional regulator
MSDIDLRSRSRRPAGRSEDILSIFTRNVADYGYDGTNFSEIANELGISKGTIVHHYGTKDRLLLALHESYMQRRLHEARLLLERLSGPADQLAGLLYAFMLYQVVDRDATVAFQREVARLAGQEAASGLRAEYLGLVRGVLEEGSRSRVFRPGDVRQRSLLMFGCSQWAWTWFNPDGRASALEVGATLVDLILGSLLVRRSALGRLADPNGPIAAVVLKCLEGSEPEAASAAS